MTKERSLRIELVAEYEDGSKDRFAVVGDTVRIGRAVSNEIRLEKDSAVSANHARLFLESGRWLLEDLNSKNGTFVENAGIRERISSPTAAKPGIAFLVGRSRLFIETVNTRTSRATAKPQAATRATTRQESFPSIEINYQSGRLQFLSSGTGARRTRHVIALPSEDLKQPGNLLVRNVLIPYLSGDALHESGARAMLHSLEHIGAALLSHFVPKAVRARIDALDPGALVFVLPPCLLGIPWELLWNGSEFLCLKADVARQAIVDDTGSFARPEKPAASRVLIVVDPREEFPDLQHGAEGIFETFRERRPDMAVTFLSGKRVTRFDLLTRLGETDIAYYAGHARFDQAHPENSGWLLNDGCLTCADFKALAGTPRLVFANACETAKELGRGDSAGPYSCDSSMCAAFILAGVNHYVGAAWPVTPTGASSFANAFFDALLAGYALGQAVRQARQEVIRAHGRGELAWAAYTLYGAPNTKIV